MRIKSIMTAMCLAAGVSIMFSGCGSDNNEKETKAPEATTAQVSDTSADSSTMGEDSDFKAVDVSAAGWKINILNTAIDSELSNVSVSLGYSSSQTNTVNYKADEGYKYVLIKLSMEKDSSTENIEWEKMNLVDAQGNKYSRIEDGFLDDLSMERMPGTTLNFGTNEGWIAFMVPEEESQLTLKYDFKNESMEYSVN